MKTETIHVEGMSCMHCRASVTNALTALPGVSSAEVSLEEKTARVTYDENQVTPQDMKDAIIGVGFDVV